MAHGFTKKNGVIKLASEVSGTLPVANGGTGVTSSTGTTNVVLSNSPTLVTPALGTVASGNIIACSGAIAQVVSTITGAVATGTTTIPFDDTIPQNTEGDEYMTLAITPKNTNNKLLIVVQSAFMASTAAAGNVVTTALFQDSTADSLAAVVTQPISSVTAVVGGSVLNFIMTAGTTSATTFKVRIGASAAGTTTFNGAGGARFLGGKLASGITITEYVV